MITEYWIDGWCETEEVANIVAKWILYPDETYTIEFVEGKGYRIVVRRVMDESNAGIKP